MRFSYSALFIPMLLTPAAFGEAANIVPPSLGLVYDGSASGIRQISGIPGAAALGQSLDAGFPVAKAAVAGERQYLLATSAGEGQVRLVRLQAGIVQAQSVDGALQGASRIALSPLGESAVLFSESAARLQVITGLPGNARVAQEFSTETLGSLTADPAVSDDGKRVLVPGRSLWLFDAESGLAEIPLASEPAALSFRTGTQEALVVARGGELYRLESSGAVSRFGGTPQTSARPVAVRLSPDGSRGYVAFEDGLLASVEAASEEIKYLSCQCKPTGLHSLNASKMFRINDPSPSPLLLFDVSGSEPRLWFVPPVHPATEVSESAQ